MIKKGVKRKCRICTNDRETLYCLPQTLECKWNVNYRGYIFMRQNCTISKCWFFFTNVTIKDELENYYITQMLKYGELIPVSVRRGYI